MKLTYRGVQYDYNPPVTETQPTAAVGKYRGVDVRFRTVTKNPVHPLKVDLMYRGVPYTTGETVEQPTVAPAPALTIGDRLRALAMDWTRDDQRREQSMLNRLEEELGLN
jgi:hypothetical protein